MRIVKNWKNSSVEQDTVALIDFIKKNYLLVWTGPHQYPASNGWWNFGRVAALAGEIIKVYWRIVHISFWHKHNCSAGSSSSQPSLNSRCSVNNEVSSKITPLKKKWR